MLRDHSMLHHLKDIEPYGGICVRVLEEIVYTEECVFSTWQFLHEAMLGCKAVGMNPLPSSNKDIEPLSPVAIISLAAGFSGVIAAAASRSFDSARTGAQCVILPKYTAKERKFLKWNKPGKRLERWTGIHPTDRNLLFRGIGVRMARSSVASFVIVGTYYLGVDLLVSK